ncbi:probable G-protein coupled receptor 139 [Chiloscyllium plagiosum]|uniref:probable G-protein coupled receptor 139 n=1 Tax=Chiloscyllium plagiosum TaxID=36176 RepID=UPI001CB859F1|nr:probable G-protein coupled receptor 139 [Chiloscyllium plagiosum]
MRPPYNVKGFTYTCKDVLLRLHKRHLEYFVHFWSPYLRKDVLAMDQIKTKRTVDAVNEEQGQGLLLVVMVGDGCGVGLAASVKKINLMAILILSQRNCGLSRCITLYLIAMAMADFLVVISDVLLRWLIMYFPVSFLDITYICSLITVFISAATVNSVWLTVAFTFDRFVAICCQKFKTRYCTEKTAAVIIGTVSVMSYLESVPWFFYFQSKYIFNNLPWFCITKPEYYTSTFWILYVAVHRLLSPLLPCIILLILNTLTVRHIVIASKARRRLQKDKDRERTRDLEMDKRRKSIVLLFAVSGCFIILWTPYVACFLYQRIAVIHDYSPLSPAAGTVSYMLQLFSTCTNTCIYTVTQRQFREQLKTVMKLPFTIILRSINQ